MGLPHMATVLKSPCAFPMSELLIIRVPNQQESAVTLKGEPLVIGSNPSSHIVVNDPAVLPHHAYLARDQGHWRVAPTTPTFRSITKISRPPTCASTTAPALPLVTLSSSHDRRQHGGKAARARRAASGLETTRPTMASPRRAALPVLPAVARAKTRSSIIPKRRSRN